MRRRRGESADLVGDHRVSPAAVGGRLPHDVLMLAVPAVLLVLLYFVYVDVPTPPSGDGVFPTLR